MGWLNLEGKVAVVTGGAYGIGRAVCEGFAGVGAHVVVADINEEGAQQVVAELKKKFGGEHISTWPLTAAAVSMARLSMFQAASPEPETTIGFY